MLLLAACPSPATAQSYPLLPPDLPLTEDGVPTKPLNDDELYRLLLALSARNDAAAGLLAGCHSEGAPYGSTGWRACVERRRS